MDQCRLMSWAVHDAWIHQLFKTMSQTPPPGFQHVKVEQLIRADREMWTLIAQEFKGSLKPDAAGAIPLDDVMKRFAQDPRITMFLLPMANSQKIVDKEVPTKKPSAASTVQAAAKSTTKKRKTRAERSCPDELKQFQLRCEHGPVCWAYNMKTGCKNSTSGKPSRCTKGFHVCANCHKPGHSVLVCRSLSKADTS